MVIEPGTVLASEDDRYVVREALAHDDEGTRYRARTERNEREVVLEVRTLGSRDPDEARADLAREIDLLETVSHPNVPTFYEAFPLETDGTLHAFVLVHEHLDGLSLETLRRQGRTLSPREMRSWFSQILGVLAHLQMQCTPIRMRHVAPSTVWIRSDRESFLVGLGSDRATERTADLRGLALTYLSMASSQSCAELDEAPLDASSHLAPDDALRDVIEAMLDPDPLARLVDAQAALDRVAQLRSPSRAPSPLDPRT